MRRVCIGTAGLFLCRLFDDLCSYHSTGRSCLQDTANCTFPQVYSHACACLELCSCPSLSGSCRVQLLDFSVAFKTWNSVHFLGHFLMVAIIAVSMVNPPRKPRKKDASKAPGGQAVPPIETGLACQSLLGVLTAAMTHSARHWSCTCDAVCMECACQGIQHDLSLNGT